MGLLLFPNVQVEVKMENDFLLKKETKFPNLIWKVFGGSGFLLFLFLSSNSTPRLTGIESLSAYLENFFLFWIVFLVHTFGII